MEQSSNLKPSPLFPTPSPPEPSAFDPQSQNLDAGALFVLESKGSWVHCGYHLTTSIVAPALLSLPFALAFLGWVGGVLCLIIEALVTFYSYNLLSLVLEHHAQQGLRLLRFREMAEHILVHLPTVKTKWLHESLRVHNISGLLMLILAQIPSFHSLRHINLVSLILALGYSACATAGAIYIGSSSKAPRKDYSLSSDGSNRLFGIFNAIAIIATTYGNGIIPEIQATLAPPVKGKMFKGLCICYAVVITTFFSVAISGYWAFGNQASSTVLSNFLIDGKPLVPKWFLLMTNVFALLQVSAVGVVYLQPMNEVLEAKFGDPKSKQFSPRNVVPRLVCRSLGVVIATTIAAMLPFFGDINAVIGAFGFMPLDFILPMVFYNITFKPSKRSLLFWGNTTIAIVFTVLGVIGAVSAVRQIVLDAKTFRLFANV
ncbi:GABA transporter 1-like protein [Cinnamomum micranthum f. kanehirae]|uniref:GABA transporter 1-like protein n=1 Tax=Cinnamomum micranthum f. kanehirae TaxID=337451 RepID=A0A443NV46_9MAGN|nr:GABA transporter 1-like protein [Cinnamomum micranthum f. kanehirae]